MEIILTSNCKSFTGKIGSGYGYYIRKIKNRFFSQRSPKGVVPPDGHWRFILACAELAQLNLHIANIKVHWLELTVAVRDAHHWDAADHVCWNRRDDKKLFYNAADIINLKNSFGL